LTFGKTRTTEISAARTGRTITLRKIPWYLFLLEAEWNPGYWKRTGKIGHLKIDILATALNRAFVKLRIESRAVCRLLKNDESSGASDFQRKLCKCCVTLRTSEKLACGLGQSVLERWCASFVYWKFQYSRFSCFCCLTTMDQPHKWYPVTLYEWWIRKEEIRNDRVITN
jgi:hypothetical protein